jgi:hypothetical protein
MKALERRESLPYSYFLPLVIGYYYCNCKNVYMKSENKTVESVLKKYV